MVEDGIVLQGGWCTWEGRHDGVARVCLGGARLFRANHGSGK